MTTNTPQDKIQSFAFCLALSTAVCLSIYFAVSNLYSEGQSNEIHLESRINPNTASLASLTRLPGIGLGRAGAILTYREDFRNKNGNRAAFENCDDLKKVKGIGPKTTKNICEWLKFE